MFAEDRINLHPLALKRTKPLGLVFRKNFNCQKSTPKTLSSCMAPSLEGVKMSYLFLRATPLITLVVLNLILSVGLMGVFVLPALVELAVVSICNGYKFGVVIGGGGGVGKTWSSVLKKYADGLASESGEVQARMEASALNRQIKGAKSSKRRPSL